MESIAAAKGIGVLDCPVVLGQEAANNGTITSYVGGEERWVQRARPVLAAFSAQVLHLGPVGAGQIAKTINNMLLWACMAANFEALTLAKRLGADIRAKGKFSNPEAQEKLLAIYEQAGKELMKQINQDKMQALLS